MLTGVYLQKKKDQTPLYRASISLLGKRISLGSFETEQRAHEAYLEAHSLFSSEQSTTVLLEQYSSEQQILPFTKWVVLLNYRDNKIYIKTPIYLEKKFFTYYYSKEFHFKFDVDDLFYYSNHKIMKRGNHLFVADYGMQVNILSRYGIKNYAIAGKDFRFVNGDDTDYRYHNIEIINRYHGVSKQTIHGKDIYTTRILVNGNIIVGRYPTEHEAAAAYNRAAMILNNRGVKKKFPVNYIEGITSIEYANLLHKTRISSRIRNFNPINAK